MARKFEIILSLMVDVLRVVSRNDARMCPNGDGAGSESRRIDMKRIKFKY